MVGVVIRCTIGAASEGLVGTLLGQILLDCVAIETADQLGSSFGGDLGRADPARECFKAVVDKSLYGVGQ